MREGSRIHVVVTTHTPRHLAGVLAGLSRQSDRPDSITVSSDTDDPGIGVVMERWRDALGKVPLHWVRRAHTGEARPAQTRNNGVRALSEAGLLSDRDLILMLDGDIVLNDQAVSAHRALANTGYEVVVAFRISLDPAATDAFDPIGYGKGGVALAVDGTHQHSLRRRQREYERDLRFRRLPWAKRHRPKMIGCHHAVTGGVYRRVNGYDEEYAGYASEDDDFSRRVNALRPRPKIAIAVDQIPAFHLWHPTRDSSSRKQDAAYLRFKRGGLPTVAVRGLENPRSQPEPFVTAIVDPPREIHARST